jgi:hypothetical protein
MADYDLDKSLDAYMNWAPAFNQYGKGRLAMAKNSKRKAEAAISDDVSQEQVKRIRERAYELYEARGREDGRDIENWLQAEAEFKLLKTRTAKS